MFYQCTKCYNETKVRYDNLCPSCYIKKFGYREEEHPRDEDGKWTAAGGGATGTKGDDEKKDEHRNEKGIATSFVTGNTYEKYRNPDGTWKPERQKLHDEIITKYFESASPVENPVSYVMGGGTAAGKSELIKNGDVVFPNNVIKVDVDEIKELLPEYGESLNKDRAIAAKVHEESSYLSKLIIAKAGEGSYNTILDGTGDGDMEGLEKKVSMLRAKGQKVIGYYATVPVEEALRRNEIRSQMTGRYVPESIIRTTHACVSRVLPQAIEKGLFDEVTLYNTMTVGKPVPILSAKKNEYTIHNENLWNEFLDKGKVTDA